MDVYLIQGCTTRPNLPRTCAGPDRLSLPVRLMERRPGFLGLDLSLTQAEALLDACRAAGARGSVVAAQYRQTQVVSMEAAMDIADHELNRLQRLLATKAPFEPTRFVREEALWWVFCRPSEALIAAGYVPGALFVAVDKLDGHVWSEDSQAEFLQAA